MKDSLNGQIREVSWCRRLSSVQSISALHFNMEFTHTFCRFLSLFLLFKCITLNINYHNRIKLILLLTPLPPQESFICINFETKAMTEFNMKTAKGSYNIIGPRECFSLSHVLAHLLEHETGYFPFLIIG